MARARRIQIRGEQWRIVIGGRMPVTKAAGCCDPNTIHIRKRFTTFKGKRVEVDQRRALIHEVLHACFPDLKEREIKEAEDALDTALDLLAWPVIPKGSVVF